MKKNLKRNIVMAAVLLFVCAAVYLNWTYNKRAGEADPAMVQAEDLAAAEAENGYTAALAEEELKSETRTMIIYEAPHRLLKTLGELRDTLGNRRISVCRELTKKHETIFRTDLEAAIRHYETEAARGECVLVIEGRNREEMEKEKQAAWEQMTIAEHVALYEQQGIQHKEAMRLAAKDRGVSKRDIYQALLEG